LDGSSAIMHIINSIGDEIDAMSARILIENCYQSGLIDKQSARLMDAAISKNVMHSLPPEIRSGVRASILKELLLVQL
ncbi:MAG: CtsR family transcriptional regulator, partial [Clostridia bacterium]|nr:CtsR family transcriptional regulator [Clostridia bacterium]